MFDTASRQNLDASRLLFDLKRSGELVNRFTGWLDADAIATCTTNGLIETFDCAFARIWIVEDDHQALRLVSSAGLYTRLNGSFARVPMGAFKVGKIAQHCIPFLSNALSEEDWVKDKEWAVKNEIRGFAGLPLIAEKQAIGVLAIFSHSVMAPELLEVLQILSLSVAGALASALNHQAAMRLAQLQTQSQQVSSSIYLSEQLAAILGSRKLSLLGVEHPLDLATNQILIQIVKNLAHYPCQYCRLVYESENVVLAAMLSVNKAELDETELNTAQPSGQSLTFLSLELQSLSGEVERLGGTVQTHIDTNKTVAEVRWQIPQQPRTERTYEQIIASVGKLSQSEAFPRVDENGLPTSELSPSKSPLSEREREVIVLLSEGLRDREISEQLYISERTVKFHTTNMLKKLSASTRAQAIFKATKQGWI